MTFLFNAGFIYSTINRDWLELKIYKQKIDQLEAENKRIISHLKLRDEHINAQLKQINRDLNK